MRAKNSISYWPRLLPELWAYSVALIDNAAILLKEIKPLMEEVTRKIHHTHPNYDLEALVAEVFRSMPTVKGRGPARGRR